MLDTCEQYRRRTVGPLHRLVETAGVERRELFHDAVVGESEAETRLLERGDAARLVEGVVAEVRR